MSNNIQKECANKINGHCHTKQVIDEHMIKTPVTPSSVPAITGFYTQWRCHMTEKQADPNRLIALNLYFRNNIS